MYVINARNVAKALPVGINYLRTRGKVEQSRAGMVLVSPVPVTTVYTNPTERVLLSAERDANPFFHLAEALWMLGGRNDAAYLNQFVKNFGERFAEPDGTIHGAYGFRWRHVFGMDQLNMVLQVLRKDPASRQAVISMWDPVADLDKPELKDRPCNTHIYLRINEERLDITVCCRSNDALWGAYGANAVHFSVLQEYLAAKLGVQVGVYYQISNNFHVYVNELAQHEGAMLDLRRYSTTPLVTDHESFDEEVLMLLENRRPRRNRFLAETAYWMIEAYIARKVPRDARECLEQVKSEDWRIAGQEWIDRRSKV